MRKKINFLTLSQGEAEDNIRIESIIQVRNYKKPVMISITGPVDPPANIKNDIPILRLQFDDIESPVVAEKINYPAFLFEKKHAIKIFEFLEEHKPDLIITHCQAGVCRSAAINAALNKIFYQSDDWYFKNKVPNMLVYTTLLNYWHCDMISSSSSCPENSLKKIYPWLYKRYLAGLSKIH